MDQTWTIVVSIVGSVMASTGMWAIVLKIFESRSAQTKLLLGLAHDRIIDLGMQYLERGWITKDEYDDLNHYLWQPYSRFGGNGLADKVKKDVDNLPIYSRQTGPLKVTGPDDAVQKEKDDSRPDTPNEGDRHER